MKLNLQKSNATPLPISASRIVSFSPEGSSVVYRLRVPTYLSTAAVQAEAINITASAVTEAELNAAAIDAAKSVVNAEQLPQVLDILGSFAAFLDNPKLLDQEKATKLLEEARHIRAQITPHSEQLREMTRRRFLANAHINGIRLRHHLDGWSNAATDVSAGPDGLVAADAIEQIPAQHFNELLAKLNALTDPTEDQVKN